MINAMPNPMQPHEHLLPQACRVVPSNINAWRGSRRQEQRFTNPQLGVMSAYNLDPTTCDYVVVRSSVSQAEMWWPTTSPAPVFLCPCPIVQRRADGEQLLVISPAGMKKWVYADGSITRAKPSKWKGRAARG